MFKFEIDVKRCWHVCSFEGTDKEDAVDLHLSVLFNTGDWSNGMIGVSKTFGGSSILSSPVYEPGGSYETDLPGLFFALYCRCNLIQGASREENRWLRRSLQ